MKGRTVLSLAFILMVLVGVGTFAFGLLHLFDNNQVTPDFVLTLVGAAFAINSGVLAVALPSMSSRIDDLGKRVDNRVDELGKRIDGRFEDLGLSAKRGRK